MIHASGTSALKLALTSLMDTHPSQGDLVTSLIRRIDSKLISEHQIVEDMRAIYAAINQSRDNEALALRKITSTVSKQLEALLNEPNLSARHRSLIETIKISDGISSADLIASLLSVCQSFSEEALHFRSQSKVIVGDAHARLKNTESNVIAGDVSWSSRQIISSVNPLLQRMYHEFPENTNISELVQRGKHLAGSKVVDFFEAISLMEDGLRQVVKLQGKKQATEAEYLLSFQNHLKGMHQALENTIQQNTAFSRGSAKEKEALLAMLKGFKEASLHEDDPVKLKKLISDNVSHMSDSFQKVMSKQDVHLRQQQRAMDALQAEVRQQTAKQKTLQDENDRLAKSFSDVQSESVSDHLTGLGNRRAYEKALARTDRLIENRKDRCVHGQIVLDIDHFKQLNDNYGHATGDMILKAIALLLSKIVSANDTLKDRLSLFRYGGEEFVILYSDLSLKDAIKVSEAIRKRISTQSFKREDKTFSVTVSVGVASYSNLMAIGKDVFEIADKAMYQSKKTGRNRVTAYLNGQFSPIEASTGSNKKTA